MLIRFEIQSRNKTLKGFLILLTFLSLFCLHGCSKFVQIDPPATKVSGTSVYSENSSAAAVMTGLYSTMMQSGGTLSDGTGSIGVLCGLSADELKNYYTGGILQALFYSNAVNSQTTTFWTEIYSDIYTTNAVLEGLAGSTGVTPSMKSQLTGEAKFMRAFFYFYAVNLFGDVPLVTTTDYLTNKSIKRSPRALVYQQIITDLKDAQSNLTDNYLDANGIQTPEKVRPNKGAATALLARVYLYNSDWADAKIQADSVILNTNTNYLLETDLTQTFLANSAETIWQLQPVNPIYNTYDGYYLVLTSPPGTSRYPFAMSSNLVNAFEPNDARFANWVDSITDNGTAYYFPFKYRVGQRYEPVTEYLMVLRLAEQYLIRAEAEANGAGGGIMDAIADLNVIRERASLPDYAGAADQPSVLAAILHERQAELFTEWGQRWFDLKRTGNIDPVMSGVTPQKGGTWNSYDSLFPIPQVNIQLDPNLTQTPGYN